MIHAQDIMEVCNALFARFKAEGIEGTPIEHKPITVSADMARHGDGKAYLWYNSPDQSTHTISEDYEIDNKEIPENLKM